MRNTEERNDYGRVFASLCFVNRRSICQLQFIQLAEGIIHSLSLFIFNSKQLVRRINSPDDAHITVEDPEAPLRDDSVFSPQLPFQLIIVSDLHDLVSLPKNSAGGFSLLLGRRRRVQISLQNPVETLDAKRSLSCRCQDLYLRRIRLYILRELFLHQSEHNSLYHPHILPFKEKEIPASIIRANGKPGMDPVCIDHDIAFLRLPENPGKHNNRKASGPYDVPEHTARSDARKLVLVTHQNQPCSRDNR